MASPLASDEERSKALFGNKDMLILCDRIAQSNGQFNAKGLSEALGTAYPTTQRLLVSLATVGLLERSPRAAGEKEQWYTRHRHKFWAAARDLRQDWGGAGRVGGQ